MDTVYTFTPSQLWSGLLAICAAVVSISAAVNVIAKAISKAREPNSEQNRRLDHHDEQLKEVKFQVSQLNESIKQVALFNEAIKRIDSRLDRHSEFLEKDKTHLSVIDDGNRVTQRALLALLSHALDGNSIEPMREAKQALETYLIDR